MDADIIKLAGNIDSIEGLLHSYRDYISFKKYMEDRKDIDDIKLTRKRLRFAPSGKTMIMFNLVGADADNFLYGELSSRIADILNDKHEEILNMAYEVVKKRYDYIFKDGMDILNRVVKDMQPE